VDICNVVNWIQKIVLQCAVLLIVIVVRQREDRRNLVNWIKKIVLHCAVLVIAVQQRVYSCIVVNWIQKHVLHCA